MASRYLMESDIVRAAFPGLHIDPHKASVKRLQTTEGGVRFTTSVGGPLTGTGGDLLIFDDLSKAEDVASATQRDKLWDWFTGTALTRRDPPKTGAFVLVAQRLHEDDIPGRLIATGQCKVLTLPAIETRDREIALPDRRTWRRRKGDVLLPEHMDLDDFERMRAEIGHPRFEAQYQQSPVPAGGNIVRSEWFRTYQDAQKRDDYEAIVQNWDVAAVPGESNDYSVCTTWGLIGSHIDLLYVYRTQQDPPQLLDTARRLRAKWRPELLVVETQGVGRSHYSHLLQDDRRGVRSMTPKANKVERMSKETYTLERDEVRLPADAPWKEVFLVEVAAFPNGKYDDQVDSMSQALHAIRIRPAELRHCSRYKGR